MIGIGIIWIRSISEIFVSLAESVVVAVGAVCTGSENPRLKGVVQTVVVRISRLERRVEPDYASFPNAVGINKNKLFVICQRYGSDMFPKVVVSAGQSWFNMMPANAIR